MGYVQGAANSSATSAVSQAYPSANTGGNGLIVIAQVAEPFGGLTGMTIEDTRATSGFRSPARPQKRTTFFPAYGYA